MFRLFLLLSLSSLLCSSCAVALGDSSTATIKGLCQLSNQDASVINAGQYISKIEAASDKLQYGILRTLGIVENGVS